VVDRNLITGIATIRLVTLAEDSPLLRGVPANEPYPVIAEGESQMQQITQTMSQLASRADEVLQRISTTLSPANQAAIAESLENLRVASRGVNALTTRAGSTLASISHTADTLDQSMRIATGDFHRLADRYDTLGAQAGERLREATQTVQQVGADVSRLAGRTEDLVGDADTELHLTGQQVRTAADAIGTTSRNLSNPRAALFGPARSNLGPGEATR